jgi:2-hydroxy-palmitic acid dioxygenase Mpo1-like
LAAGTRCGWTWLSRRNQTKSGIFDRKCIMLGGRSTDEWVRQYARSHQHPVNCASHAIGIPLIAVSVPLAVVSLGVDGLWPVPLTMFVVGWILQFVGHWFEGKPPEFFSDWRFLFVGPRWWVEKVRGRVVRGVLAHRRGRTQARSTAGGVGAAQVGLTNSVERVRHPSGGRVADRAGLTVAESAGLVRVRWLRRSRRAPSRV